MVKCSNCNKELTYINKKNRLAIEGINHECWICECEKIYENCMKCKLLYEKNAKSFVGLCSKCREDWIKYSESEECKNKVNELRKRDACTGMVFIAWLGTNYGIIEFRRE